MTHNPGNILLYTPTDPHDGFRWYEILNGAVLTEKIIEVKSIENLIRIFRQPCNGVSAAVIFHATENELERLMPFRDILLRKPFILVLADNQHDTVAKGHSFRPRFMTFADRDLTCVREVLEKMLDRMGTE